MVDFSTLLKNPGDVSVAETRNAIKDLTTAVWRVNDLTKRLTKAKAGASEALTRLNAIDPRYTKPLHTLGFDDNTLRRLEKRYDFVHELVSITPWQLPEGIGKNTYKKVVDKLKEQGLYIIWR